MGKGKKTKVPASVYLHEALGLLFKTPVSSKEHGKCAHTPPETEIGLLYFDVMEWDVTMNFKSV